MRPCKFLAWLIICVMFFSCLPSYAFKLHNPFSKKSRKEAQKMVETRQEWMQKAQNINLEDRKIDPYTKPVDKKYKKISPPERKFVKYNVSPGEVEVNLSRIKKELDIKSQGVIDPNFRYMVYGEYYYSAPFDQISSDIFVQEMKSGVSRMKKALDTTVLNVNRTPAISTGTKEFREHMFSTLSVVDWSKDSSKILIKEKIGSSKTGIYRNYVWIYYLPTNDLDGFGIKYSNLNETIKGYFKYKEGLALDNYRWDIKPLGFSADEPDLVIVESYAWDNNKKQVFLGVWGLDCTNSEVKLLSETPKQYEISVNGLVVKEYLP